MLETVTMRTTGKNVFDSFDETFLTIGEEFWNTRALSMRD
jgi:hypothetical protein